MPDSTSLISLGELSKPATVLIEKVADAIGGLAKPWQIRRVARAEADAEIQKAITQLEISGLQQRALARLAREEVRKQHNIESVIGRSLPGLEDDAQPQDIDDDWIASFFDKCRLVSDADMQELWAQVLAGEANAPGTYSKRTVDLLGSLDKSDATLFTAFCGFCFFAGQVLPLIYDYESEMYTSHGIDFLALKHLDAIGLVCFESISGYRSSHLPKIVRVYYYGMPFDLTLPNESDNQLQVGLVIATRAGEQLARICGSKPVPGFPEYVFGKWSDMGLSISSPYPREGP